MKKINLFLFFAFASSVLFAQSADELAIKKSMADQTNAWNRGSIDDFMKTYWNDDSLTFIGHGGITYGYNNTLNNYKTNYNDASKMGKLFFTLIKVKKLSPEYYFVTGKWFLKRSAGDIGGYYTLLFRKIKGQWLIITDHTS
jgi:ketosteroid isomerase-like protein